MFSLKGIIFKLFGSNEKLNDTYKDINGKGILERYNESLAEDFDENALVLIDNLVSNTKDPFTAQSKFLSYLENDNGLVNDFLTTEQQRRQILSISNRLFDIRGTIFSYKLMLKWLGVDEVYIIEHEDDFSFDSIVTFDSPIRTFDNTNYCGCREYSIQLYGSNELTPEFVNRVFNIVKFNEPIDADLREITYNGINLNNKVLSIYISDGTDGNQAGDLIYDNEFAQGITLRIATLDDEPEYLVGDVIIEGENAYNYMILPNGDMIYIDGVFYFNNCLKSNGVNEYLSTPHDTTIDLVSGQFSSGIWVRLDSVSGNNPIVNKMSSTVGYDLSVVDGKVTLTVKNLTGENKIESTSTLLVNEWYNLFVEVLDEDVATYKIYINGTLETNVVITSTLTNPEINNTEDVVFGYDGVNFSALAIDTYFIAESTIDITNVKKIYNFGDGENIELFGINNILILYNFDEVNGLTIFDTSGNENHATLAGIGDNTNHIGHYEN